MIAEEASGLASPVDADREVLSQLVAIVEDHDQIDVELDFEIRMLECGARVLSWEEHVQGNLKILKNIAVGYLDVLNLGRVRLALERLHAH